MTHSIGMDLPEIATKHKGLKSSQNKLDNPNKTAILQWAFLLIFILNQSYDQTHLAD